MTRTALEDASIFGQAVRPVVQYQLAVRGGAGNEKAYCGRTPWLFDRPGVDYLLGPGFLDPRVLARRAASGNEWKAAPAARPAPGDSSVQEAARRARHPADRRADPDQADDPSGEVLAGVSRPARAASESSYVKLVGDLTAVGVSCTTRPSRWWPRKRTARTAVPCDGHALEAAGCRADGGGAGRFIRANIGLVAARPGELRRGPS